MSRIFTSESVVAYSQCPRKAFFLLRGEPGRQHEYEKVLEERASVNRSNYLSGLSGNELQSDVVYAGDLVATCDALVRNGPAANKSHARYEPHVVVGTAGVSKEQKLALAYAGYVVGQTKRYGAPIVFLGGSIGRNAARRVEAGRLCDSSDITAAKMISTNG